MLAVETIDLTKDYAVGFWRKRPKRALDRLNLRVNRGEIFGLLGPNGAGKSTTLKILLRLLFPTSGSARLLGRDFDDVSVHARMGYLPEHPYFYDHLTAGEFLTYAAGLFGISGADRRARVGHLLDRVGLAASRDLALRKFSKGMVQRLGVAQAVVNDPELIILDEPMSGLDPIGRRQVRDLMLELKGEGKTILFSTHILPDAETLCDRVAILNLGRLQGCGELGEILRMGVAATEVVLEGASADILEQAKRYARSVVRTGDRVRIELPADSDALAVLDIARQGGAKIISMNPVKVSLEDYFLTQVAEGSEGGPKREKAVAVQAGGLNP